MNDPSALINSLLKTLRQERSKEYMVLGDLINTLESLPCKHVVNLHHPHSYRGYYEDLAFELGEGYRSVDDLLAECKNSINKRFEGYKGGSYLMRFDTPVWVANYGESGKRLASVLGDGAIEIAEDDD